MEISIIINNYKTRGLLKQCLKGIKAFPPSVDFEIVVVDNNSRDGSVELVREMFAVPGQTVDRLEFSESGISGTIEELPGKIKIIAANENLGHHKGNNLGIRHSSGKYILIMNTDVAVFDDALNALYRFMEEHPEVALAGPRLHNADGSIQRSCMRFPRIMTPFSRRTFFAKLPAAQKDLARYLMDDFDHNSSIPVDWILGACEIVRRSALDKVGLMDESLFLYFGDVALCHRLWDSGFPVYYFAGADMIHYHRRESNDFFSKLFWIHIIDWIKYLIKYNSHAVQKK